MANRIVIKDVKVSIGDEIKVYQKVLEKGKERIQAFQGVVISISGSSHNRMFTVRKIAAANIAVERIWPVDSPLLTKVEIKKKGRVRKAKLYYLRSRIGKQAAKVKTAVSKKENVQEKTGQTGRKFSLKTPTA